MKPSTCNANILCRSIIYNKISCQFYIIKLYGISDCNICTYTCNRMIMQLVIKKFTRQATCDDSHIISYLYKKRVGAVVKWNWELHGIFTIQNVKFWIPPISTIILSEKKNMHFKQTRFTANVSCCAYWINGVLERSTAYKGHN